MLDVHAAGYLALRSELSRLLVLSAANAVLPSLLIKPESSIRFAELSAEEAED